MSKLTQEYRGIRIRFIGARNSFVCTFQYDKRVYSVKVKGLDFVNTVDAELSLGMARRKIDELLGPETDLHEAIRPVHY